MRISTSQRTGTFSTSFRFRGTAVRSHLTVLSCIYPAQPLYVFPRWLDYLLSQSCIWVWHETFDRLTLSRLTFPINSHRLTSSGFNRTDLLSDVCILIYLHQTKSSGSYWTYLSSSSIHCAFEKKRWFLTQKDYFPIPRLFRALTRFIWRCDFFLVKSPYIAIS
jgi:hypothetical protein